MIRRVLGTAWLRKLASGQYARDPYDYLMRPGSAGLAAQVLRSAGYNHTIQSVGFEPQSLRLFRSQPLSLPTPDAEFYTTDIARGVDLHFHLWPSADQHLVE